MNFFAEKHEEHFHPLLGTEVFLVAGKLVVSGKLNFIGNSIAGNGKVNKQAITVTIDRTPYTFRRRGDFSIKPFKRL